MNASAICTPFASRSARSVRASSAESAIGFSHSTCLPALRRENGPRDVHVVRQGIVHRLDIGIGEHSVVGAVRSRYAESFRCRPGFAQISRRDGDRDRAAGSPASPG